MVDYLIHMQFKCVRVETCLIQAKQACMPVGEINRRVIYCNCALDLPKQMASAYFRTPYAQRDEARIPVQ